MKRSIFILVTVFLNIAIINRLNSAWNIHEWVAFIGTLVEADANYYNKPGSFAKEPETSKNTNPTENNNSSSKTNTSQSTGMSQSETINTNIQSSNIKNNIEINDKNTLTEIRDYLKMILEEIKKGHFNIFNVNLQNGNTLSNIIDNTNFNNLNNQNVNYTQVNNIKNQAKEKFNSILNWVTNNKKRTATAIIFTLYAAINYKLTSLTFRLLKQNNWSKWQSGKTLEEFYRIPQSILAEDILKAIQNHYMQFNNITDHVTPISKFILDVNKEIDAINTYVYIINIIRKFKMGKFFAYSNKIYLQAPDRLNRLAFFKNIFLSWLADHKISQFRHVKRLSIT